MVARRGGVIAFLALTACGVVEAPGPAVQTTVLEGATVVDGTGAPPRAGQTVVLEGERIRSIGPPPVAGFPEGARVIDVSGRWIVPGFVDLHVHLPPDPSLHQPVLSRLLEFGITSILNPGARPETDVELRDRIAHAELSTPASTSSSSTPAWARSWSRRASKRPTARVSP